MWQRALKHKCAQLIAVAVIIGCFTRIPAGLAATVQLSTIVFRPGVVGLRSSRPRHLTLRLKAYDAFGNLITPSTNNPITINVYGAPSGVILPTSTSITSGHSVTLAYNGQFFPNPITVEAYTANNGVGGNAIGVARLLPQQKNLPCAYGTQNFTIPFDCSEDDTACPYDNIAGGLKVFGAIGYNHPTVQDLQDFTIDTGSLGAIVPSKDLGPDAIGPAGPGVKFYNSSGNTFAGYYYLARVSMQTSDGSIVQTNPIMVLAVDQGFCAPGYPKCTPPGTDIHYLGVGFDRNSTTTGDAFDSPADNPFLQITDILNGVDISPGYILTGENARSELPACQSSSWPRSPTTKQFPVIGTAPLDAINSPRYPAPSSFAAVCYLTSGSTACSSTWRKRNDLRAPWTAPTHRLSRRD
jgi:hypothetical protein